MITGYNTDIKHDGRVFHVQTEDKGVDNPTIESLVYCGGKIIDSRQCSYGRLLAGGYSEKKIQELLDSQHRKMLRDIRGGKYDEGGPPKFGAGIISDRGFDEVVLEFIRELAGQETLEVVLKEDATVRAGELVLMNLAVRGALLNGPVSGAEVVIKLLAQDGKKVVKLYEGVTDETGCLQAGVEIPREFGGATMQVDATSPMGSDELKLPVQHG